MEDYMKMVNSSMAVVTRPGSTAPFDAAKREASTVQTLIGLVILGLVGGIVGLIQGGGVGGLITAPIFTIVVFYIFSGILYVLAKVFGGTGDFTVQSYLLSLVAVPTGIVNSVLGLVPVLGILSIVVGLYAIFLDVYAIKSSHALDTTKAAVVVLIPVVVVIVLIALFGAALGLAFLTGMQGG